MVRAFPCVETAQKGSGEAMPRSTIDGERKALLRRVDAASFLFVGLVPRSVWESAKASPGIRIVTQRVLMGATLHVQSLAGQLPIAGETIIPAALLKGRSGQYRSGRAMDAHLTAIATQRKAERAAFKVINSVKVL
jgi:hypothetical protein